MAHYLFPFAKFVLFLGIIFPVVGVILACLAEGKGKY
jgi:hypothetical protein